MKALNQQKTELLRNILFITLGSLLYALNFDLFLEPGGISSGGVSGIAMIIVYAAHPKFLTVGILNAMINIPLFLCGLKKIGRHFFFGSLYSTVLTSVFLDLFARILPVPAVEPLVAALFGGVFMGVSLGLVFLGNASTGGVDIVARLMKLKFRNFPIGKIILCMDLTIAVITGVVYRNFNNTLYSVIAMVVSSMALDRVVYGMDYSKVALIITEKYEAIATAIDSQLDRGVTLLKGQGYYKRQDKMVLLSAVKRKQLAELKELVMDIDPDAFIILQDAHQVLGDGFKPKRRTPPCGISLPACCCSACWPGCPPAARTTAISPSAPTLSRAYLQRRPRSRRSRPRPATAASCAARCSHLSATGRSGARSASRATAAILPPT